MKMRTDFQQNHAAIIPENIAANLVANKQMICFEEKYNRETVFSKLVTVEK